MKRHGHLYEQITDLDNLWSAHKAARKGKTQQRAVKRIDNNPDKHLHLLHDLLESGEYRTGRYSVREMAERGKARTIYRLPYWPDRVVQHAIAQVMIPIWQPTLIRHTYASIKGRGIHDAAHTVRAQLRTDRPGTKYCLKMDVRKFYPTIPHDLLVGLLSRKIKDARALDLLEEIVRSVSIASPDVGVPIGNYLSQWFANLYLSPADWRIKQHYRVRYYHRYCDDLVLLHHDKSFLHRVRWDLSEWLSREFRLDVKGDWQVFPVQARGVDFVGYRMWPDKTLLRKPTKKRMAARLSPERAARRSPAGVQATRRSAGSYDGWTRFGSTRNLRTKIITPWMGPA